MPIDLSQLTNADIEAAYQKLGPQEQAAIDTLASALEENVKRRRHKGKTPVMFGRKQSLEILAKLGVLFVARNVPA